MNDDLKISTRTNISNCINKYLSEHHQSKAAFARAIGVSDTSVKRWVNGVCSPELDLLPVLCEYMNVSIFELLGMKRDDSLDEDQANLLKYYASCVDFQEMVKLYMNDPKFKAAIDYITSQSK